MALWIAVTHWLADCERHRDCDWLSGVALADPEASYRSFPIDKQLVGWLTGQTAKYSGVLIWAIPTVDWLSAGTSGSVDGRAKRGQTGSSGEPSGETPVESPSWLREIQ